MDQKEKDFLKMLLRAQVETFLDFQRERIAFGNRLIANFRYKMGLDPKNPNDREIKELYRRLKVEASRLTDAIAKVGKKKAFKQFKREDGLISAPFELDYVKQYFDAQEREKQALKIVEKLLDYFPIWTEWLVNVEGVGPAIGGYLVSWLDPAKAPRPSSFWRYAGLHVVDGKAPRRIRGQNADWNHRLRSKLLGVLGDQFVKRPRSYYGRLYRNYKHRLEHHQKWKETTPMHRHRAAVRYAVKIFLKDLWTEWRKLEGLPVLPDYAEAKLGYKHAA